MTTTLLLALFMKTTGTCSFLQREFKQLKGGFLLVGEWQEKADRGPATCFSPLQIAALIDILRKWGGVKMITELACLTLH